MTAPYDHAEKGLPQAMRSIAPSFLGRIRGVFSRSQNVKAVQYTPESHPTDSQTSATTGGPQATSFASPHARNARVPPQDKLATFRRLTGITSAREHKDADRPALNLGIYARVVKNEREALNAFTFSSRLINGCLALQLIVAASLTALGAGNGPHAAVTVFGAVNTIIAGFLTYLKGSGLPNRHKFYASSWSKVREYMEQREREFEREDCPLEVEEVIRKVEDMYEEVRQDVEANEPEAYTSTGQLKRSEGLAPGPQISDKTGEFSHMPNLIGDRMAAMAGDRISPFDKNKLSQTLREDRQSGFSGNDIDALGGSRLSGLEEKLQNLRGDRFSDLLAHRKAEADAALYHPNLGPIHEVDQHTQAAMEAGAEKMDKAKHMETEIKGVMKVLASGVERMGPARSSEARAAVASEMEEERLGAAKAMEESAEKLNEAGEQRLDAAKTMAAKVEDALSLGMQKAEKSVEDLM